MSETLVLFLTVLFQWYLRLTPSVSLPTAEHKIRKYISPKTIELLVHAFVSSKLDFCNSLLYGIPKHLLRKLQSVQNAAVRLVTSLKFDHVTPILVQLHWLPIAESIKFKIVLLTFKCLHDLSPFNIKELLTPCCPAGMLQSIISYFLLAQTDYNMRTYGARTVRHLRPCTLESATWWH